MKLKEIFKDLSGGKILDVGTGVGNFIPVFQECFKDYTEIVGIDTRDAILEKARGSFNRNNISFVNMDASNMGFQDNSFDTVCLSNTLHHLPNMNEVLKEMKRVLKPGGYFIINEMFCDNQTEKQMSHVNIHHFQCDLDTLMGICHNRTYKKQEIVDITEKLGLTLSGIFEHNTHEEQLEESNEDKEKQILDEIFSNMDKKVELIKEYTEYADFKNRIEELKNTLYDNGFFTATALVVLGRK
jgi:ubiquinone/menaquinone biosynthesis C-methylase UbiE